MNQIILIGRLTREPEMKFIPGTQTAVASMALAVDRGYTKKDGTKETDFIPVEAIGKTAEFCQKYCAKGKLVAVQGSIRVDRYESKDGQKKTFTKVSAKTIQPLEWKSKGDLGGSQPIFEPNFEAPQDLDPNGFQAIDDDDIPF